MPWRSPNVHGRCVAWGFASELVREWAWPNRSPIRQRPASRPGVGFGLALEAGTDSYQLRSQCNMRAILSSLARGTAMDVSPPPGAEKSLLVSAAGRKANIFDKCLRYSQADETKALGIYPYFRLIETGQDTEVVVDGHKMLMLGSNSYLELTTHPKVKERAIDAIRRYGTGCAGSRFLNGTLPIHLELEERLAELVGKEAALVYSTGYQTNTGVISCLVQRGEYILSDKLNHACIVEGALLSPGTMVRYNHSDMRDLERRLAELPASAGKLIVS